MLKLTRLLLLLLLILISACSIMSEDSVGVINGKRIPYSEFITAYRSHYENFYTQNNRPPDLEEKRMLEQETWGNITKYVILQEYYKRYDIMVSAQEVLDTLSANPPDYIINSPWFQVNGSFDRNSYLQSLNYDTPHNLRPVRKHYYDNVIPILKLKEKLIDNEFLNRRNRTQISRIIGGSASIDWLLFDVNNQNIRIPDSEIETYYTENMQAFLQEPYYTFSYSLVPAVASANDLSYSQAVKDSILLSLSEGRSFETIVNSNFGRRENLHLTDTGYIFIPELNGSLREQLGSLSPGQYAEPVQADSYIDIYRLEHMTRSMVKFSKLSIPIRARDASVSTALRTAQNLRELAASIGFAQACGEMDLSFHSIERLNPTNSWLDDPEAERQLFESMQSAVNGSVMNPVFSSRLSAWIVVHMLFKQNQEPLPLAVVRDHINNTLIDNRKVELATQLARVWIDQNKPMFSLSTSNPQFRVLSIQNQAYGDSIEHLDVRNIYYRAVTAFLNQQGPVPYSAGNFIMIPVVRSQQVSPNVSVSYGLIREAFVHNLDENWFTEWMNEKIRSARVKTLSIRQVE